ncbi:uncharacterized protein LOC115242946 [Formica exsecta]|uniref:uncharacterized protein LOC115242946 n=1 Tax=Formica exsecta TaxID=72781 RepID=UPI001141DEEA|nr:uncharacterized protein LOC115242946 [Formica exsecta]
MAVSIRSCYTFNVEDKISLQDCNTSDKGRQSVNRTHYLRYESTKADNATTQVKVRHTPSFAALTTKMFPQNLLLILLFCVLYCHCYVQIIEEEITATQNITKTAMNDAEILSTVMVCNMFFVMIVLVPTMLYYRYYSKEKNDE